MEFKTIETPSEDDLKSIKQGVIDYGLSQIGGVKPEQLAFHLHSDSDLIGGAYGFKHFGRFFLEYLWVQESERGKGHGKNILMQIANCVYKHGCSSILLHTVGETSKPVYLSIGFKVVAKIPDYIPGFNQYHLVLQLPLSKNVT